MSEAPPPYSATETKTWLPPPMESQPFNQQSTQHTVYVQAPVVPVVQVFREIPIRLTCNFCRADVVTSTYYETGTLTWLACFFIFLFFPLGCCLIPFCMDAMKDVVHRCPNCNQQVGRWNRM